MNRNCWGYYYHQCLWSQFNFKTPYTYCLGHLLVQNLNGRRKVGSRGQQNVCVYIVCTTINVSLNTSNARMYEDQVVCVCVCVCETGLWGNGRLINTPGRSRTQEKQTETCHLIKKKNNYNFINRQNNKYKSIGWSNRGKKRKNQNGTYTCARLNSLRFVSQRKARYASGP